MQAEDLSFMPISELSKLIARRQLSPVELVEAQLARIRDMDDVLRAFIYVDGDAALAAAKAAEAEIAAGSYRGLVHGVTVAHKDIVDVRGLHTTGASKLLPDYIAAEDATVVAKLRAAGTICLGKLNLIEFASGSMGVYGFARNPWNLAASPGGSSSGSGTALAAGLVTLAVGTDTGGSVRNPACLCGLVGLRPTYGRVSRYGVLPLSWSQDDIGPMGRNVADVAMMLGAMAGPDRNDPTAAQVRVPDYTLELDRGVRGMRLGVPRDTLLDGLDPDVDAAMLAAVKQLEALGAQIVPISLPASQYASAASWTIAYSESFVYHHKNFETRSKDYTPAFYHKITAAGLTSSEERIISQQIRQLITREWVEVMQDVDVVVTPTNRGLAPSDSPPVPPTRPLDGSAEMTSTTRIASLTGFPAMSVPIGFSREKTPMGMQLIGRPWEESTLFRMASAYEKATGWNKHRPEPFPSEIPPPYGVQPAAIAEGGSVDAAWVSQMASLLGYGFVTGEDAAIIAGMLSPVKDQLQAAKRALNLNVEPATRPAGLI